jgi:hypothetical protein
MTTREFSAPTHDQLEEVQGFLAANPIKVPVKGEDGVWSFWSERALADEARRTALREAVDRYDHELLDDEERVLLQDRIRRLRRQLKLA